MESRNENISLALVVIGAVDRVPPAFDATQALGSLVKGVVLLPGVFVLLLALNPELLGDAEPVQEHALLLLEVGDNHLLALSLFELVPQFLLLVLLELLQLVQEVHFALLVGLDVLDAHPVGPFGVLLARVLALHLGEHGVLLNRGVGTPSFSLKDLDSYPILWLMSVSTIFLLYLRWSLISLLSSAFLACPSSCFFFSYLALKLPTGSSPSALSP